MSNDAMAAAMQSLNASANPVPAGAQQALTSSPPAPQRSAALHRSRSGVAGGSLQRNVRRRPAPVLGDRQRVDRGRGHRRPDDAGGRRDGRGDRHRPDPGRLHADRRAVRGVAGDDISFFLDAAPGAGRACSRPTRRERELPGHPDPDVGRRAGAVHRGRQQQPAALAKAAAFLDADIAVASVYGRWDRDQPIGRRRLSEHRCRAARRRRGRPRARRSRARHRRDAGRDRRHAGHASCARHAIRRRRWCRTRSRSTTSTRPPTRFEEVYAEITETVVAAATDHGEVLYAVPGSPLVLERSVGQLLTDERVECDCCRRCRSSTWRRRRWASTRWRLGCA